MLALIFTVTIALPPGSLVPIVQQCPALSRTWTPLFQAVSAPADNTGLSVADDARQALHSCGARVRDDERALALILLGDADASISERTAIARGPDDSGQLRHRYWYLYDQVLDDAVHYAKFLHFAQAQQCGTAFQKWITAERDALWQPGLDPNHPLLSMSGSMDRTTLQCVSGVTGWSIPSPQKA